MNLDLKLKRIIAVDPGYERVGIAIIEKDGSEKEKVIFSECFLTSKTETHGKRLSLIGEEITSLIKRFAPIALAIENLFLNNNHKTAMKVAEAKGTMIYEAKRSGLAVFEYSPPQIKLAVTGNGRADKKSMMKMIPLLVKIDNAIKYDDEFDAIAVGLAHFAISK